MSDEIGSGDSLVSVVKDASISPADLDIPVHNVALECGFVLSRISASDEVIGYKSPVFQDNKVCVCVCVCINLHINIHTYIYIHTHTHTHTCFIPSLLLL
jgi:hypothetical protein